MCACMTERNRVYILYFMCVCVCVYGTAQRKLETTLKSILNESYLNNRRLFPWNILGDYHCLLLLYIVELSCYECVGVTFVHLASKYPLPTVPNSPQCEASVFAFATYSTFSDLISPKCNNHQH